MATSCFWFCIPGEPVAKGRPRVYGKVAVTPEKTKNYERLVGYFARQVIGDMKPYPNGVKLTVKAFFGIPKSWTKAKRKMALAGDLQHTQRPDFDNVLKAVTDGMNGIIFNDDSQVCRMGEDSGKFWSDSPRVEVTVEYL